MGVLKNIRGAAGVVAVLGAASMAAAQEGGAFQAPEPTAEHKVLAADAGTWDGVVKSFVGGPEAEPATSKGTEVNTVVPPGLWLLTDFTGEFGGQSFRGHGQFGYDPVKKKYVGSWIDSLNPCLSVLEGTYDAKTKTMTYEGEGVEPVSKTKFSQKIVTVTKADGTRVMSYYMKSDATGNKEVKGMEVTYTRRK